MTQKTQGFILLCFAVAGACIAVILDFSFLSVIASAVLLMVTAIFCYVVVKQNVKRLYTVAGFFAVGMIIASVFMHIGMNRIARARFENSGRWVADLDYQLLIADFGKDSVKLYDQDEWIDTYYYRVKNGELHFRSASDERFHWELVSFEEDEFIAIEDGDTLVFLHQTE